MKVIHIDSEKYFGGGQNQVYLLNKYLLKKGIKSAVFCPESSPLFSKLKEEKCEVYPMHFKTIFDYVRKQRPDIVHVHSGKSLTFSHFLKILVPSLRVVFTRRITKGIKFCFLRKFFIDAIICISEDVRKSMERCFFPAHKIFVVYSGVEREKPDVPLPEWYREDKFIVGNIGYLLPYKDHITLIRGFYEFLKICPESLLVIIGEGREKKRVSELIEKLKIGDRVILTGFLSDAASYIRYFSVFVITSRHTEGLCSSIIDAFMQRVPVIATNIEGIRELVKDGKTGVLIEREDFLALKEALLKVKEDKDFVQKITYNAHEFSRNFTAEKMVEGNIEVYRKVLSSE